MKIDYICIGATDISDQLKSKNLNCKGYINVYPDAKSRKYFEQVVYTFAQRKAIEQAKAQGLKSVTVISDAARIDDISAIENIEQFPEDAKVILLGYLTWPQKLKRDRHSKYIDRLSQGAIGQFATTYTDKSYDEFLSYIPNSLDKIRKMFQNVKEYNLSLKIKRMQQRSEPVYGLRPRPIKHKTDIEDVMWKKYLSY